LAFLKKYGVLVFGVLISVLITLFSASLPFFWDTIQLGSEHANWFYSNRFKHLLLPDYLDSGHFPVFGMYLAVMWSLLGKSLWVSHFAMFPFLVTIIYYLYRIGIFLTDQNFSWYFLFLLLCNPFFLGQSVLVSPDIVLLAFFVVCLHAYLRHSKWQLLVGAIGLSLVSQRGFMIVFVLGAWILITDIFTGNTTKIGLVKYILPGIILAMLYQLVHYLSKGWIGYHEASPWSASFESVDSIKMLLRNTIVFAWRMIDYGNIVIWIGLLALIAKGRMRDSKIMLLLLMLVIALAVVIIPKAGLLNHRYFLVILIVATVAFLELIYKSTIRFKHYFVLSAGLVLVSGNFWTYPEGIAQGWDSTLNHIPYYSLFDDALSYMDNSDILLDEVGSSFPANNRISDIYLNENESVFKPFDLDNDQYILYSNVMNEFQGEHLFEMDNLWKPIFKKEKGNIVMILYERK